MNSITNDSPQILIVDDDELFSETLSMLLKEILNKNTSFEFAYTGSSALELLDLMHFDIVFLDNKLPDKTGLSILNEIRRKKITTNVIFITGYSDEEIAVKAMKLGAVDYISKGNIDLSRLGESINEILIENCSSLELDPEVLSKMNIAFSNTDELSPKQTIAVNVHGETELDINLLKGLETLFEHNMVEKTKMFSTPTCPDCDSHPNEMYLICPICNSKSLEKGEVIEHNKCHHIDFKSNFIDENNLFSCPKCGESLKQIGVDYVKVGSNYRCHNSHIFPHPEHEYVCGKCQKVFTENQANLKDMYEFKLLEEGKTSLRICESANKEENWDKAKIEISK